MKRLDAHIQYFQNKREIWQTVRFFSGIVFLVLLIVSSFQKWHEITFLSVIYWIFIFPLLVRRIRKLTVYINTIEQKKFFILRQADKKNGILVKKEISSSEQARELLLVGSFSIYSFLNETWTQEGEECLKSKLEYPGDDKEISIQSILDKQRQIKGLACYSKVFEKLLFRFFAINDSKISLKKIQKELDSVPYKSFKPLAYFGILVWLICILISLLQNIGIVDPKYLNLWFLYLITLFFVYQKNGSLFFKSLNLEKTVRVFRSLFETIDKNKSEILREVVPFLSNSHLSKKFKSIEILIAFLSVETHILVNLIINIIFPYYLVVGSLFVSRAKEIQKIFPQISNEIEKIDFLSSLVYLYKYHTQVFPKVSDAIEINVSQMYLPLISQHKVIKNDFVLKEENKVNVLMGSNMSGKSTFLRTLGLNQTLSLLGAPVFAKNMNTFNGRVLSCILIEDSIEDSVSYFMKEVKRLKFIFENVKENKYLFLIDELFKGTNPKERLIAARSYLGEIGKSKGVGIITTHDPELGFLEKTDSKFKSWHMEDHKIRLGPATSTNALDILKKEGLPVYES